MGDKTEDFIRSIPAPAKTNIDVSAPDDGNDIQTIGINNASVSSPQFNGNLNTNVPLNLNNQLAPGFVINSTPEIVLHTLQSSAPVYVNPGVSTDNYYFNNHQIINPLDPAYKKKLLQTRNIIQSAQDATRTDQMLNNVNANTLLNQNPFKQMYPLPTMQNMPYQMGALTGI